MILTTKRHGRSRRDVRNLLAHLNKQFHQTSRVVRIGGVPVSNADDAVRYMQVMRDASRASVACHHVSISPRVRLTAEQIDDAVQRILVALGAEDHAYVLWKHSEKPRADADVADEHYHLVIAHVGPDGRALDDSWSYVRMEAAARSLEVDFHEPLTPSRMTKSVIKELRRLGRDDVADMLTTPVSPPSSAMSSRTRAKADRYGIDLPEAQVSVRAAWAASDGVAAFRNALADAGMEVAAGSKANVFIVTKNGGEIGALDRIVREKRAVVAARMKEERNVNETEATQRWGSDLPSSSRCPPILGEPATASPVAGRELDRRRTGAAGRNERPSEHHRNDPGGTWRNPRPPRRRVTEAAAVFAIGRDDAFRKLRRAAEAVASGEFGQKSPRRRAFELAATASVSGLDLSDLRSAASKVAAGSALSDTERMSLEEARMKSVKPTRKMDFKTKLFAEVTPHGFDVSAFADDIHMVKKPSQGNPTARIMLRDGGWCEIDIRPRKAIRTWGPIGRAQVLAQALAEAMGCEVTHLAKTMSVGANADALHVAKMSEDTIKSLAAWWTIRGYRAVDGPDGCWINAGHSRIRDIGDQLEIHGGLSDAAIAATLTKARDAWDGAVYLDGHWTPAEQDRLWIAAQRAGIEIQNCNPSPAIQSTWQREQEAAAAKTRTISAVRTEIVEAQDLIEAAKGNVEAAKRLPGSLQAFVAIHIDDDQRKELAAQPVAAVIPELTRFRKIGATELDAYEEPGGRKLDITGPVDGKDKQQPDNGHAPR
jgi:hypothetical protein